MRIAIIPARANSKSIPNKNLKKIGDHSLIGLSILAAKESNVFDRIIVSTDGDLISKEAISYGAEVIKRPSSLALDDSKSIDAVIHVLESLSLSKGICVLLQPTSPLRGAENIANAVNLFTTENGVNSLVSVCESNLHPYKMILKDSMGQYHAVNNPTFLEYPRQSLPKAYQVNGAIYINDISKLLNNKTFFIDPVCYFEMSEFDSVDIDYPEDLEKVRGLIL